MGIKRTKKQGVLKEINDGHYIELTDRCHVMARVLKKYVREENVIGLEDEKIKQLTDKISELHYELYQIVANEMFKNNGEEYNNNK